MSTFKRAKMPTGRKKYLSIIIGKEINELAELYCEKAGIGLQEVGYAIGRLCTSEEHEQHLSFLMQIYFCAALFYKEELKDDDYEYGYLTKRAIEKRNKEFSEEEPTIVPENSKANYIG